MEPDEDRGDRAAEDRAADQGEAALEVGIRRVPIDGPRPGVLLDDSIHEDEDARARALAAEVLELDPDALLGGGRVVGGAVEGDDGQDSRLDLEELGVRGLADLRPGRGVGARDEPPSRGGCRARPPLDRPTPPSWSGSSAWRARGRSCRSRERAGSSPRGRSRSRARDSSRRRRRDARRRPGRPGGRGARRSRSSDRAAAHGPSGRKRSRARSRRRRGSPAGAPR